MGRHQIEQREPRPKTKTAWNPRPKTKRPTKTKTAWNPRTKIKTSWNPRPNKNKHRDIAMGFWAFHHPLKYEVAPSGYLWQLRSGPLRFPGNSGRNWNIKGSTKNQAFSISFFLYFVLFFFSFSLNITRTNLSHSEESLKLEQPHHQPLLFFRHA